MKRLLPAVWVLALTLVGGGWLLSSGQREQNARHPAAAPVIPIKAARHPIWEFKRFGPPARFRQRRTKQMPLASSYDVAGSGDASYDGSGASGYIDLGATSSGAPVFEKSSTRFLWWDGSQWTLSDTVGAVADYYYNNTGSISDIPETGWAVGGMLSGPAPTVTAGGNPQIAQGASSSVSQIGFESTVFDWEVRDSSTAVIGDSTTPNGWDVQDRTSSDCTVFVPVDATIATDYRVVWESSTGYYADFDVIAGGAPPAANSGAGFLSVLQRRG